MPVILSTLVILIAAIGCWILSGLFIRILFRPYSPKDFVGFRLHGIIPAVLPGISRYASQMLQEELLSKDVIAEKLSNPALMQELKPEIEVHIDQFLQTRLKEAFPLLSNFMGEKTLGKFKAAFLTEVETILPDILKSYSGKLMDNINTDQLLAEKISNINMEAIEKMVQLQSAKQVRQFRLIAALLGATIGMLQVILIYLY